MEKARWEQAREDAKKGCFEAIPADIYIKHYSSLHRIFQDNMPQPASIDTLQNEWIYGPTGVGKSRSVRDYHPLSWLGNKWWDGYKGEEVIVIDEVSPTDAEWIAPMFKVWADHYPFIAEMKGRSVQIRPKHTYRD